MGWPNWVINQMREKASVAVGNARLSKWYGPPWGSRRRSALRAISDLTVNASSPAPGAEQLSNIVCQNCYTYMKTSWQCPWKPHGGGGGGGDKGKSHVHECPSQKNMVRISPNSIGIIHRARG